MLKKFESFVDTVETKGVLYIESDDGQYDENWTMSIDISKIWQSYANNTTTIQDFNNQYAGLLIEQQQNISKTIGDACWNDIEPIAVDELRSATNEEQSETIYNKLYDVFDKYDIYIDTGKIQTDNEIPTEV